MAMEPKFRSVQNVEKLRVEDLPDPTDAPGLLTAAGQLPSEAIAKMGLDHIAAQTTPAPEVVSPWRGMDTAPKTGAVILLTEDVASPVGHRALYYKFSGTGRPWSKPIEGWICPMSRRMHTFEPKGWAWEATEGVAQAS